MGSGIGGIRRNIRKNGRIAEKFVHTAGKLQGFSFRLAAFLIGNPAFIVKTK